MFSTLPKLNFNCTVTFILSSANAFNLDQSKILSFGNELRVNLWSANALYGSVSNVVWYVELTFLNNLTFYDRRKKLFEIIVRKCWLPAFSLFRTMFLPYQRQKSTF